MLRSLTCRSAAAVIVALTIASACSGESESSEPATPSVADVDSTDAATADDQREDGEDGTESDETPATGDSATTDAYDAARQALTDSGRVDLNPSGNRVALGPGALLDNAPIRAQLDATARWIVPTGPSSWFAVLDDGSSVDIQVGDDGDVAIERVDTELSDDALSKPPLATTAGPSSFDDFHDLFIDPLPDTRVVVADDALVALAGPTDRYAHGVLGDTLEASAIELATPSGDTRVLVELAAPDVFEAVSPMVADANGDGIDDVVVTVSNADSGARVVAYSLADGSIVSETDPIGQGNRWRNLLAVAPVGPDGEIELIDIQTPHIGGILQFFRADGERLELVASTQTYSTHSIGSRNLDLGIVSDADGDGQLDVIVPIQGLSELAVITRDDASDSGTREVGRVDLGGLLTTNVAAAEGTDGVSYAAGIQNGVVLIWP